MGNCCIKSKSERQEPRASVPSGVNDTRFVPAPVIPAPLPSPVDYSFSNSPGGGGSDALEFSGTPTALQNSLSSTSPTHLGSLDPSQPDVSSLSPNPQDSAPVTGSVHSADSAIDQASEELSQEPGKMEVSNSGTQTPARREELEKYLQDKVAEHYDKTVKVQMNNKELTKGQRGPVLSGVLDMKDESEQPAVHFGRNDAKGRLPEGLHPVLQTRVDNFNKDNEELLKRVHDKQITQSDLPAAELNARMGGAHPGSHSEIYALNSAMNARKKRDEKVTEADLHGFLLHNQSILPNANFGSAPNRCFNCAPITSGVSVTNSLAESEGRAREQLEAKIQAEKREENGEQENEED